jgi:hypothetical protein
MAVESLHGYFFKPPVDGDDEVIPEGVVVGPTFGVNPDDVVINIDVTSLLFDNNPEEEQLYIMIQDRGPEREQGGDRFYTRESTTPPQLLIDFTGGDAADIVFENIEPNNATSNPEANSTNVGVEPGTGAESPSVTEAPIATPAPSIFLNDTNSTGETGVVEDGGTAVAQEAPTSQKTDAPSIVPAVRRRRLISS